MGRIMGVHKNNAYLPIIGTIIMICLSINAYNSLTGIYNTSITLYELIIEQFNNINVVAFPVSVIILCFFYYRHENYTSATSGLKQAFVSSLFMSLTFFAVNFIITILSEGFAPTFSNQWSYDSEYSYNNYSPATGMLLSIGLVTLRSAFLMYLMFFMKVLTKQYSWGIWLIFFLGFLDFRFYSQTHILYPLYILPIEHTRIVFTCAFRIPYQQIPRFSIFLSLSYWIILVSVMYIVVNSLKRRISQRP